MKHDDLPTRALAAAVGALCERNERTRGATAGDVLLGERCLVVLLKRPITIDGECWDVSSADGLVDILDLMDDFQRGRT